MSCKKLIFIINLSRQNHYICTYKIGIMQKHDLLHEFPEHEDRIRELKVSDSHFRRLFDEYHEVDHEVHRIETGAVNTSDEHLDKKRTHRVYLKDELYRIIINK